MSAPLLSFDCVTAGYGGGTVISEVSLDLGPGEIVGILGSNGVGKTTTMRVGVGLLRPSEGRVLLDGAEMRPDPTRRLMLYSSGTTGKPKGVLRAPASSPAAFLSGVAAMADFHGYERPGAHLVTGPLYHAVPLAFAAYGVMRGQTVVMMERFDAAEALSLIEKHRITTTHMVPTMFIRLLHLPEKARQRADLSSLAQVYHGAAPCPAWAKQAMIDWLGPRLTEYYGASEGGGPTKATSAEWLERPGTVGRPSPGLGIDIVDDEGRSLPPGEVGTVYFRAAEGPPTYHGDPDKTRAAQLPDGRYTVGDVGYLDEDGYLYLVDRKVDLIISGGVNIYPAEVEACLSEHPAVADCTVFGVPDEEWGEAVKAAVELVEGHQAAADQLVQWCRERIAPYKAPRSIDFHPPSAPGRCRKVA